MTYYYKPGMVEDGKHFLEACLHVAERQQALFVHYDPAWPMYKVHQLLSAPDYLPLECGGRFRGLRERVRVGVRQTPEGPRLLIQPKRTVPQLVVEPPRRADLPELETDEDKAALAEIVAALTGGIPSATFELGMRDDNAARRHDLEHGEGVQ